MKIENLMYPFGNPVLDMLNNPRGAAAMNNVLLLAKERVWLAEGRPLTTLAQDLCFDDSMGADSIDNAKESIRIMESILTEVRTPAGQHVEE